MRRVYLKFIFSKFSFGLLIQDLLFQVPFCSPPMNKMSDSFTFTGYEIFSLVVNKMELGPIKPEYGEKKPSLCICQKWVHLRIMYLLTHIYTYIQTSFPPFSSFTCMKYSMWRWCNGTWKASFKIRNWHWEHDMSRVIGITWNRAVRITRKIIWPTFICRVQFSYTYSIVKIFFQVRFGELTDYLGGFILTK